MRFDNLSDLPEWDDEEFKDEDEEGEEWKPNPTREACKKMYLQWQQVMTMLNGAIEMIESPETEEATAFPKEFWDEHLAMIRGDGFQVAVKIKSSETGLYVIRMENASIIRKNAQFIYSSLLSLMAEKLIEESYVRAIRKEIDVFRELFKEWVATFEKDEFIDEWGLFV